MTVEELRQRLVLLVRLHVAQQAESYADEVLDRLALKLQRDEEIPAAILIVQALAEARSLIWEAKLRLARGESTALSSVSVTDDVARASARAALSVALSKSAESQAPVAQPLAQPTRAELRDLLLHRLPELDAQHIEEQLLLDGDVAAGLRAEEGDLLDDYSAERLDRDERADVERFVLTSSSARQRVKISRALRETRNRRPGETDPAKIVAPWNRWSLRAAGAIVVCMLAVVFYLASLDDDVQPTPASPRRESRSQVSVDDVGSAPVVASPDDPDSDQASAPFNVLLLADQQAGFGAYPLSLTGDAADVRLQVEAPSNDLNSRYQLVVQDESGKPLFLAKALQPREAGGMVIVETLVPARSLGAGIRKVVLSSAMSTTAVATWSLDVQREQ